jgi:hypothetical protein
MNASFSPLGLRSCGWCQAPLQGRSDKQFCSAACRGMAARHGTSEGGPIDWQARVQQAEQTVQALQAQLAEWQHAQQAAEPFEHAYDELSKVVSVFVPEMQSSGSIANFLDYVEGLLERYEQHPGLAHGDVAVHRRMQNLQWLHGALQRQEEHLQRLKPRTGSPPAEATAPASVAPSQ